MKKTVILAVVAVLIVVTNNVNAQNFTLGVKGGISIPNLTAGGTENPINSGYSSRFGPDYGVFGEYHFSELFSLSLGLEYSSQGGVKDKFQAFYTPPEYSSMVPSEYLYADFKSEAVMNYILMPLMVRVGWDLGRRSPWRFNAGVGPFAGYLLNAKQETSGSSLIYLDETMMVQLPVEAQSFDGTTDIKDQLNEFNTGVIGFIGFSYSLAKSSSVFIEGGGNFGFIQIQKNSDNGTNYTGAAVVTIGYAYSF